MLSVGRDVDRRVDTVPRSTGRYGSSSPSSAPSALALAWQRKRLHPQRRGLASSFRARSSLSIAERVTSRPFILRVPSTRLTPREGRRGHGTLAGELVDEG